MAYEDERSRAFAQAATICRTRAAKLSPATASTPQEFEVLTAKIDELTILADLFDNHSLFPGSGSKNDFMH